MGRVEWLRAAGLSYRELEERGYGFVVVEALVRYRKAAYFDDELVIRAELTDLGRASFRFTYELRRGEETICTGHTRHGCIEISADRPTRLPKELLRVVGTKG